MDIVALAAQHNVVCRAPGAKAVNQPRLAIKFHARLFLEDFPEFLGLFLNTLSSSDISIANVEFLTGAAVDGTNFMRAKALIDEINRQTWSRVRDGSEEQSGNSVLGKISEDLLERALANLIDGEKFFRVAGNHVKAYGDFVAMCLPNNLWISVKSNYARERLLASGYSNDILGAGFFVDSDEFINPIRVRNFQRAGFLAMYCPEVAITDAQAAAGSSTYDEIQAAYDARGQRPLNINGKPFIRQLGQLPVDLAVLLQGVSPQRRLTVAF